MITIPPERLSGELLDAIIESYVLREGTDYGDREVPLEIKIVQVKKQIDRGQVVIVFDEDSQSCNLLSRQDFDRSQ
ncbi:MAG: YheU family protein [Porticoccaceae bacterium]|nr:YheU family protein [Porticoccaceae bacterium]